ncbi:MAG: Gfo/Idh/MocA family oxidoreductase [Candidatus Latescibacteria bacterium]|nr:Gfo/Idh/MocA family oxidoreductase [Candidatus Latescibacterota bacterium]
MPTYRVAILGCRARGTAAARAYHAHPKCEVVGLCDLVPDLLNALGDELGVTARYDDLDSMMLEQNPDIVAIPTGTEFHYDLSMRILEYGVHIDVEKPMCATLEQADEVLRLSQQKGVRIAVHHQGRTGAAMNAVAAAVQSGKIGDIRHMNASGKGYYGGYGLMNIGTHAVNAMLRITGPCRSVTSLALTDGRTVTPDDVIPSAGGMGTVLGERITATLAFDSGVTATLLQQRFPVVDATAYGFEVCGTEGRLIWKTSGAWWLRTPHFLPDGKNDQWEPLPITQPVGYDADSGVSPEEYNYVEEYVNALDAGREHECSGVQGLHVMEILMAVLESSAHGVRIDLPQKIRTHPLEQWRKESGLGSPREMPREYRSWLAAEDARLGRS